MGVAGVDFACPYVKTDRAAEIMDVNGFLPNSGKLEFRGRQYTTCLENGEFELGILF